MFPFQFPCNPTQNHKTLRVIVPVLILLVLTLLAAPAQAKRNPIEFPDIAYDARLSVTSLDGDNILTWEPYTELQRPFKYDIYYAGQAPSAPGENTNRIVTGARNKQWIDTNGSGEGRCIASNYFIVAYGPGKKDYSAPAQGSGPNLCDSSDNTPPVLSINKPTQDQVFSGTQLFSGTASDADGTGVSQVTLSIVGPGRTGPNQEINTIPDGNSWLANTNLMEGEYFLTAYATDEAGNQSEPVFVDFAVGPPIIDTSEPTITLLSPQENQEFSSRLQTISGTVDDNSGSGVDSVQIEITGSQNIAMTVPVSDNSWSTATNLPDGTYQIVLNASDRAGNQAASQSRSFTVNSASVFGADGYADTAICSGTPSPRVSVTPSRDPTFENDFNSTEDIHDQLKANWKSAFEWRESTSSDVIINNESQFYLDVLGYDATYANQWSPFEQLTDESGNGYLAIRAAKSDALSNGPVVNGAQFAGQDYLSGVLTTFDKHSLSPDNAPGGKVVVELRARMPRGQGVFPAAWLYNEAFQKTEIDIFEYIGQSPDSSSAPGWKRPDSPECGDACVAAGRKNYDTFHTQYHGYYVVEKNQLKGTGSTSVDNNGDSTGSIYTNPDNRTWWRGAVWGDCRIDFSDKFHTYTLEWSAEELVYYIDDIVVLRLDELADSGGNLPGVNFVPIDTRPMYLTLNFALGSTNSYIGAPDTFTQNSMDMGDLRFVIDYIKVWQ